MSKAMSHLCTETLTVIISRKQMMKSQPVRTGGYIIHTNPDVTPNNRTSASIPGWFDDLTSQKKVRKWGKIWIFKTILHALRKMSPDNKKVINHGWEKGIWGPSPNWGAICNWRLLGAGECSFFGSVAADPFPCSSTDPLHPRSCKQSSLFSFKGRRDVKVEPGE